MHLLVVGSALTFDFYADEQESYPLPENFPTKVNDIVKLIALGQGRCEFAGVAVPAPMPMP